METLLHMSNALGFVNRVRECFNWPIANCPDLLCAGLVQTQVQMNLLRQQLLEACTPAFFNAHPNGSMMLQYMWNSQQHQAIIRQCMLNAMGLWFTQGNEDQARLMRILEVSHDLKCLQMLLNLPHYPFAIDLAVLASRREYLKLDKWLTDKIAEQGVTVFSYWVDSHG